MLIESIFWIGVLLVGYAYAGYPMALLVLPRAIRCKPGLDEKLPRVTIVIAAYNEARFIGEKTKNALSADYPADSLSVIVVSDGSTDETANIAEAVEDPRLHVIELLERGGKPNALNSALQEIGSDCEIVIFTDANVYFEPTAVRELVKPFADPPVGCVSGHARLTALDDGEPLGEGAYMRYERFLYKRESDVASMAGVDGAMFACRRELVRPLPINIILDDFLIATRIVNMGYNIKYAPAAKAFGEVLASVDQERRRKSRIAAGAFQVLPHMSFLLKFWKRPVTALFFFSHKMLRWFSPLLIIAAFASSLLLFRHPFYLAATVVQLAVFLLAALGAFAEKTRSIGFIYIPYYLCSINIAFLLGMLQCVAGRQSVKWQRVDR